MNFYGPISVDPQHKVWIPSHSLAGIVGLNPAGGMDVCLFWVLCIVRHSSLRWANPPCRDV